MIGEGSVPPADHDWLAWKIPGVVEGIRVYRLRINTDDDDSTLAGEGVDVDGGDAHLLREDVDARARGDLAKRQYIGD
jgi:hypothetical protein